ncbi:VOC family protein [Paenibacillus septentrionalis]|uniref:Glyoxalase/bleomycin resistance protein/dioxygenase superfamily protein n=3 Tax=Bacillales TaxID=1385 RepID=A0A920D0L6_9BACL|nr:MULTISPECIES: VOC family protein [Bacillales]BAD63954.1 IS493 family transposase [Shouchella clausii KSM-K16]GIP18698.1 glyoxalase/bleomycin resistance protein/dioxygenase superfamily protein [Paenibacillus montaniterrae]
MAKKIAPHGYHTVTPHFTVRDANQLIEFLKKVFEAEELNRGTSEGGAITHAEVRIGDTIVELSEGNERFPPRTNTIHLFVADSDECYSRAIAAGATSLYEPADMPYGERSGGVEDPFGNHWYIATFTGREGHGYY